MARTLRRRLVSGQSPMTYFRNVFLLEVRVPSKRLPEMEVELDADLRPDASQ